MTSWFLLPLVKPCRPISYQSDVAGLLPLIDSQDRGAVQMKCLRMKNKLVVPLRPDKAHTSLSVKYASNSLDASQEKQLTGMRR